MGRNKKADDSKTFCEGPTPKGEGFREMAWPLSGRMNEMNELAGLSRLFSIKAFARKNLI